MCKNGESGTLMVRSTYRNAKQKDAEACMNVHTGIYLGLEGFNDILQHTSVHYQL